MLPAGDSRMEWTLRLVGMGIDGQSRSFDVMAISRPDGLGDIANLGPEPGQPNRKKRIETGAKTQRTNL